MDNIFYRVLGEGTIPMVMIHGYLANGDMFNHLVEKFSEKYKILIPDLRGYGRSTKMDGPYDIRQLASDVHEIIQKENMSDAHILGYSMGGAVAQQLVYDYPDASKSLVLGCTFSYKNISVAEKLQKSLLPYILKRLGTKGLNRFIYKGMSGGIEMDDIQWLAYKKMVLMCEDKPVYEGAKALMSFDSRQWVSSIRQPTLIISGKDDLVVPAHHTELLSSKIPHAKVKSVEGAGHSLVFTHPDKFSDFVNKFYTDIE